MERRKFLQGLGTIACSAAAHPLMSSVTFAGGPERLGENRLVVVILRGAMDGLDAIQPRAEAGFALLRPGLSKAASLDLDGFYGLHPALGDLLPLWQSGEFGAVQATSTPYRDKRSHFDGQDILEAGTGMDVAPNALRDGWLNRMLQAVPGLSAETAYALGEGQLLLLSGKAPVRSWQPDLRLDLSPQARLLLEHIYHDDPLFREAAAEALEMSQAEPMMMTAGGGNAPDRQARRLVEVDRLADFAVSKLQGEARIAALSMTGWDTHRSQGGVLPASFQRLSRLILQLKQGLGPVWSRTAVLVMTEFGRTAAENGSGGTDHGTGGAMLYAGGALKGGQVLGPWPGLSEAALYDRRDLMPTTDVRIWAAAVMQGLFGFDRALLEGSVFPGMEMKLPAGGRIIT